VVIDDLVLGAIELRFSTISFQRKLIGIRTVWLGTAFVVTCVSLLLVFFMSRAMTRSSRMAEESLRKLEQAFATTEVGITISDNDGRIVYTNPADAKMHGYTVDELIGQSAKIFAPPEYQEVPLSEKETKGFFYWKRERVNVRKDGSRFPVRLISNPITDHQGRSLGKVVVCEDITEYKQAEAALKEEHNLIRILIDNLPDMIYIKDTQSRYLLANTAMVRAMPVRTQDELLGKTDFDFQPLDTAEQAYADEQAILDSGQPLINREEPVINQRSGNIHWVLSTKVPFYDSQGSRLGIIGINRDISDRKRMEAQLLTAHTELKGKNGQLAKLNASKDKFFSIISHDLRSPLNVVLGYSETLEHELKDTPNDRIPTYLQGLREAAEKLYTLLENLLTWSRIQRGDMIYSPNPWNLNDIATENIELLYLQAEQKQISFRNSIESDIMIYADFYMVNAILRNLLTNALKFTNPGGQIEISARRNDSSVEIAVSDTGVGIKEEDLPKLFRIDIRYTHAGTAGEEGTGLGLSLCKELVEKNKGTIRAESEFGKGTTFYFTLPCPSEG
jgi:PAS domain S-box-containing protein